uniref:Uncharacterized protein n=1 Tax=Arundo donax TaxID=35708 RepID=A0A0A8YBA6_ARUDO
MRGFRGKCKDVPCIKRINYSNLPSIFRYFSINFVCSVDFILYLLE